MKTFKETAYFKNLEKYFYEPYAILVQQNLHYSANEHTIKFIKIPHTKKVKSNPVVVLILSDMASDTQKTSVGLVTQIMYYITHTSYSFQK